MRKSDNKGMAMVSVLIAVTFIAILGSSLLFMAYMNYQTKAMRYRSTDNFYTDEFALDELSSNLQQAAALEVDVKGGMEAIRNKCGVSGWTGDTGSGKGYYDPAALRGMIVVTDAGGTGATSFTTCTISCNAASSASCNYIEDKNSVTLLGVNLVCEDENGDYYSSLTSDIVISFPSDPPGKYDINDFSVISNADVDMTIKGSTNVFTGCMYIRKKSGTVALNVQNGRCVTFLSPMGIIDGDIVIKDDSAVSVAGSLIVDGNIKIESGSSLCVTGDLTLTGKVTNSGILKGKNNISENQKIELPKETDGAGKKTSTNASLATALFAKHVYVCDASGKPQDLADIAAKNKTDYPNGLPIEVLCRQPINNTQRGTFAYAPTIPSAQLNGTPPTTYGSQMSLPSDTSNALYATFVMTSKNMQYKYDVVDCSILALGKVEQSENGKTIMTNMSDAAYDSCKNILISKDYINLSGLNSPDIQNCKFVAGTFDDMKKEIKKSYDDIKSGKTPDYKVYTYSPNALDPNLHEVKKADIPSGSAEYKEFIAKIDDITTDDSTRYLLVSTSEQKVYLPYGYIISADSSTIISDFFSIGTKKANPKNSTAVYKNWTKD